MRYKQPTEENLTAWAQWLAERPEVIQKMGERLEPWTLYLMKSTGQRVTVCSFNENGTVTVNVTGEFNLVSHERAVFGINPDDLEECDLPRDDERLGTFDMSVDEVKEFMKFSPQQQQLKIFEMCLTRELRTYPRDWRTE